MSQEEGIKKALEGFGFEVEKLDERDGLKTPDFYATKDGYSYFIELKTKEMNPETVREMDEAFSEEKLHTNITPLEHSGSFQKIIHKAKTQLEAQPVYTNPDAFNIAWFHCEGSDAGTYMEIFENILYGKVYAADFEDNTSDIAWGCYFYKPIAMFMKYKDVIDGAVISMDGSIKIFPNILSNKYEELKNSSLFRTFKEGVNDPLKMEKIGKALVVDTTLDRANLHSEIIKKYKLKSFRVFSMKSYTLSALTSKKT